MTTHPTIIFDLDGTLADTWPVALEVGNKLNLVGRQLTMEDYEHIRNLHAKEMLAYLDIPLWRVPRLLVKGRSAIASRIGDIPLFPDMKRVLTDLKKQGCVLHIMSSNSLENVQKFLLHHDIEPVFSQMQGGVSIFGKAKTLRKIVKDQELDPMQTYYVGDEVRDVEAAKKAGIQAVAVTWGLNGEKILGEYSPDFMVHSPKELAEIFKK